MNNQPVARDALRNALIVGTVLQLAMVFAGHYVPAVASLFPVLGMSISLAAGLLYAYWAHPSRRDSLTGGAMVGGGCALIGVVVSFALGDVPALTLAVGTLSSAVTGALGGVAGQRLGARAAARG